VEDNQELYGENRPEEENTENIEQQDRVSDLPETNKKKKKRRTWLIIPIILLVLILVAVISAVIFVKQYFDYNYKEITSNPQDLGFEEVIEEKIINVALFGIDTRNEKSFSGRSDSIMILSINQKTKEIKLISVMRDSFVPIDHKGKITYNKINNAYAKGGPELAVKTLNTVFGLDISEYATVNFYGMADIIDSVGGIEATVTKSEVTYINAGVVDHCKRAGLNAEDYKINSAGTQHLNGIQAVAYSRIRYVSNAEGESNDYGRTDRQRHVLNQLFQKAKSLDKSKYPAVIKAALPCCETSLSYTEILDLALSVMLKSPTFKETRVPDTKYIMKAPKTSAGSIVYYDLNFAANLIHSFIYDGVSPEDYIKENGIEKYDWYNKGYKPPVFNDTKNEETVSQSASDSSD